MRKNKILSIFFVALSFLISAFSYFVLSLPQQVVIHWDIKGNPNVIVDKELALTIVPMALLVVCIGLSYLNRRLSDAVTHPEKNNQKNFLLANTLVFFLFIACQLFIVANALGYALNAMIFGFYLIAFIMILIGNYASKNVSNNAIGLKNQWVRGCENTARDMNKLFGRLFFIGGVVCLFLPLFFTSNLVVIQIAYIVLIAIFLDLYSKKVWMKYNSEK